MLRKTLALCVLTAVALIVALAAFSRGSPTTAMKQDVELEGKIIYVFCNGDSDATVIEKASLRQFGGREFIIGTRVKYLVEEPDLPEVVIWLPVDSIRGIAIYRSLDDLKKYYAWNQQKRGSATHAPTLQLPPLPKRDE